MRIYKVIIIKVYVSKRYKKRTTDENEVKFERHVIEEGGKRMAEEKNLVSKFSNRWRCKRQNHDEK